MAGCGDQGHEQAENAENVAPAEQGHSHGPGTHEHTHVKKKDGKEK